MILCDKLNFGTVGMLVGKPEIDGEKGHKYKNNKEYVNYQVGYYMGTSIVLAISQYTE